MQMLLAAMLVDALHAALEDREIAFNRVRMDHERFAARQAPNVRVTNIFLVTMVDREMCAELCADLGVETGLVGHELGLTRDILANDRHDFRGARAIDMETASGAVALDERKHHILMKTAGAFLAAGHLADIGFVNLDRAAAAT